MKRTSNLLFFLLILTGTSTFAFAQSGGDAGGACGALACGAGGLIGLIIYILIIILIITVPLGIFVVSTVYIFKWIAKDATARGMPNADNIKWLGLFNFAGLVTYLLLRPQTVVMACPKCGKPLMPGQTTCPQCGNA